jgi:hypothetical protein
MWRTLLDGLNGDIGDRYYISEFDSVCDGLGVNTIETGASIAACTGAISELSLHRHTLSYLTSFPHRTHAIGLES